MIVHRDSCSIINEYILTPEKCIHVCWDDQNINKMYKVALDIAVTKSDDSVAQLTKYLSAAGVSIEQIRIDDCDRTVQFLHCIISVYDRSHLAQVIKKLRILNDVKKIHRSMDH